MNILVSACLIGVCCRYDGRSAQNEKITALSKMHTLIPVCPEQLGGLSTPRLPSELQNGRIMTSDCEDVTAQFKSGAEETLRIARLNGCAYAILKSHSPSCGYGKIYDGSFSGRLIDGDGITAKLLCDNGITVLTDLEDPDFKIVSDESCVSRFQHFSDNA